MGVQVPPFLPRASVFDGYKDKVCKYIDMGLSISSIHKIICQHLGAQWSYDGFYKWPIKTGLRG